MTRTKIKQISFYHAALQLFFLHGISSNTLHENFLWGTVYPQYIVWNFGHVNYEEFHGYIGRSLLCPIIHCVCERWINSANCILHLPAFVTNDNCYKIEIDLVLGTRCPATPAKSNRFDSPFRSPYAPATFPYYASHSSFRYRSPYQQKRPYINLSAPSYSVSSLTNAQHCPNWHGPSRAFSPYIYKNPQNMVDASCLVGWKELWAMKMIGWAYVAGKTKTFYSNEVYLMTKTYFLIV